MKDNTSNKIEKIRAIFLLLDLITLLGINVAGFFTFFIKGSYLEGAIIFGMGSLYEIPFILSEFRCKNETKTAK